jgi:hypothetical protein
MEVLKSKKHNGWNWGFNYTTGQKGRYLSIMIYKWTWTISL